MLNIQKNLLQSLQNPDLFQHSVEKLELIETHISWVLLTGPYAYKIKKSVNFGFLDFSSLEKRHYYCQEEIRLNKRSEPEIYIDVIAISGSVDKPNLNGQGECIEWAVRMKQFDHSKQFDILLKNKRLTQVHIDMLCKKVCRFHEYLYTGISKADYGVPKKIYQAVNENYQQIKNLSTDSRLISRVDALAQWHKRQHKKLVPVFLTRQEKGFIRECHGDLHLGNIALHDNHVILFDCIEFNENFRWIDTISDLAFLTMDLDAHSSQHYASRLLNGYLQHSGDFQGISLLRYYQVYRALVRAKVACLQASQQVDDTALKAALIRQMEDYICLAEDYIQKKPVRLIITHGLSGSGKTSITTSLLEKLGAIRIRSDVERKRRYSAQTSDHSNGNLNNDLYSAAVTRATFNDLESITSHILNAGYPVIVDATFIKKDTREQFQKLAKKSNVPYVILDFQAPEELLKKWITKRIASNTDISDADLDVLKQQIRSQEPLSKEEMSHAISIHTENEVNIKLLASELMKL